MARPRSGIEPRIVRAARRRFVAEGVDGASLRTIAKDARTSVGMVSYYFPTKDDLFFAVVEEVYADLLRDLAHILAAPAPLRTRLVEVSARIGTMSARELAVVRLVVREALSSSTRLRRALRRFERGHIPVFVDALADGVRRGELDGALPLPLLLVATFGIVGGPQIVRRVGAAPFTSLPDARTTAALAARVLFEGASPTGRAARRTAATGARPPRRRGKPTSP